MPLSAAGRYRNLSHTIVLAAILFASDSRLGPGLSTMAVPAADAPLEAAAVESLVHYDHPPTPTMLTIPQTRREFSDEDLSRLATELSKLWVRDPRPLVDVIHQAFQRTEPAPPLSLLLAIAHAETNGRILIVSEAGAVGLAQATPGAYLSEGYEGKLFITDDYLIGSHAYILKKPLADAVQIASVLLEHHRRNGESTIVSAMGEQTRRSSWAEDDAARARARRLLASANELRREGIDELLLLAPFARFGYLQKIERSDQYNARVLEEVAELIESDDADRIEAFRDRVRAEYRAMMALQRASWKKYQQDLIARRDQLLRQHFRIPADQVQKTRAYEAGEFLARELDERFSPDLMAEFLVRHMRTKMTQALDLGAAGDLLEQVTAALYNGGSHNVRRMDAGLMPSLPETENYMRKVPGTRQRLDSRIGANESLQDAENSVTSPHGSR